MQRRLAAILAADVVGYSHLMGIDEAGVLSVLKEFRSEIFDPSVERYNGRIVKLMGDGVLVEFGSVVDAVNCAVDIQSKVGQRKPSLAGDNLLKLRIGINVGDILVDDDDLYGDGVNVAARLESLAQPGGIAVSAVVVAQASGKVDAEFENLGSHRLKNIAEPVDVFQVNLHGRSALKKSIRRRPFSIAASVLLALVIAGLSSWWITGGPDSADAVMFDEQAVLAGPNGPTVAVMPFENLSGDPKQDFLATGIGEDIIVELGKYRDLGVLSRQSTHAYRGNKIDIREVGKVLGADYVLEGSVRRTGDRLRVTARLIDTRSGAQVWSSAFDEDLTALNVLDVQLQITEKVASAVGDSGGAIKRIHARHARAKPPEHLSSYECSMMRVGFLNRQDLQERVRGCILRVVEEDPEYWRGWAQLAEALLTDVKFFTGFYEGTQDEKIERAEAAARRAISLNPDSPRAHFILAVVLQIQLDREGFFAAAENALALGSDRYLEGHIGYEFIWSGRLEFGAALVRKAIALNPNAADPNWHQALAEYHFIKGEYQTAYNEYLKGAQPDLWWSVAIEVAILAKLGPEEKAISARDRLYKLRPGIKIADIVWIYRRFARPDELMVPFVEAYRSVDIPEGRYRPLEINDRG